MSRTTTTRSRIDCIEGRCLVGLEFLPKQQQRRAWPPAPTEVRRGCNGRWTGAGQFAQCGNSSGGVERGVPSPLSHEIAARAHHWRSASGSLVRTPSVRRGAATSGCSPSDCSWRSGRPCRPSIVLERADGASRTRKQFLRESCTAGRSASAGQAAAQNERQQQRRHRRASSSRAQQRSWLQWTKPKGEGAAPGAGIEDRTSSSHSGAASATAPRPPARSRSAAATAAAAQN